MRLISTFPKPITFLVNNQLKTLSPSGIIINPKEITTPMEFSIDGIPVSEMAISLGELPPQKKEIFYLVSQQVAQACWRDDFVVSHDLIRDDYGRIIGSRGIAILVK